MKKCTLTPKAANEIAHALPGPATEALRLLELAGFEAWIVGGWVRDQLLDLSSSDIDIATNATPGEIKKVFSKTASALVDQGERYGTIKVRLGDVFEDVAAHNVCIDITTLRSDGFYDDNRHPESVRYSQSIEEDLQRRDFTMNAIAYHPDRGLLDPFDGIEDIRRSLIRTVGDSRKRIEEDALRILRAVRFSCAFNFELQERLQHTVELETSRLEAVSEERKGQEFKKLVRTRWFSRALTQYKAITCAAIPELAELDGYKQDTPYHNLDILQHTARVIDYLQVFAGIPAAPESLRIPSNLGFAALLHDIGKPSVMFRDPKTEQMHFYGHPAAGAAIANKILKRLGIGKRERRAIISLIRLHDRRMACTRMDASRLIGDLNHAVPSQELALLYPLSLLREADAAAKAPSFRHGTREEESFYVYVNNLCITHRMPTSASGLALTGAEIAARADIEPGPCIGRMQEALLKLVQRGLANNTPNGLTEAIPQAMLLSNSERLRKVLFPKSDNPSRVGLELERFVVDRQTGSRVFYETGMQSFLVEWLSSIGGTRGLYDDNMLLGVEGRIASLFYTITLEPGSQLEISLGPSENLEILKCALEELDEHIIATFKALGLDVDLVASGVDPSSQKPLDVPLLPKSRYLAMDTYLSKRGSLARSMMRSSASTQISLDILNRRRDGTALVLATALSQLLYFLCDTSGEMSRLHIWNNTDAARTRLIPNLFASEDPREAYLNWLLSTEYIYSDTLLKTQLNELHSTSRVMKEKAASDPVGIKQLPKKGLGDERLTLRELFSSQLLSDEELLYLASLAFPDVRAKGFYEIRTADSMEPRYALSLAAFLKGLFYDEHAFSQACNLLINGHSEKELQEIAPRLKAEGWDATILDTAMPDLTNSLLSLAKEGLSDGEEKALLAPLEELWREKKLLSDL